MTVIWFFIYFFARYFVGSEAIEVSKINKNLCPYGAYLVVRGVHRVLWIEFHSWNIVRYRKHSDIYWPVNESTVISCSVTSVSEAVVQLVKTLHLELGNKSQTWTHLPLFFSYKMPVLDYQTKIWAPGSSRLMALVLNKILLINYFQILIIHLQ